MTRSAAVAVAAGRAARYLVAGQDRSGSWTDLRLAPGPSDAWATALVGRALAAAGWREPADRAAAWLLAHDRGQGVWGWNAQVPPDVDSTAQAILLLQATGRPVPVGALRYLEALRTAAGWPTYPNGHPAEAWTEPTVDVSAAALLALGESAADVWVRLVGDQQHPDGTWTGLWWATPAYPTMMAVEAWAAMGRPTLRYPVARVAAASPFDAACALRTDTLLAEARGADLMDAPADRSLLVATPPIEQPTSRAWPIGAPDIAALLAQQLCDGSWPSQPFLRIPEPRPPRVSRPGSETPPGPAKLPPARLPGPETLSGSGANGSAAHLGKVVGDDRRLLTTAMVLTSLVALLGPGSWASVLATPGGRTGLRVRSRPPATRNPRVGHGLPRRRTRERGSAGEYADELVVAVARANGIGDVGLGQALTAFRTLTWESLGEPSPWPSSQLSTLAGGIPLEFSAMVGPGARPALRLTAEVGRPEAPVVPRARSGLAALAATAHRLGLGQTWAGLAPALDILVDPALPVPDGQRFWVWGGMDLEPMGACVVPVLKAYVNALAQEVGGQRARLAATLAALRIPHDGAREEALRRLDEVGFLHEVGLGAAPGGRRALKVYYELAGWNPTIVGALVTLLGLDATARDHPRDMAAPADPIASPTGAPDPAPSFRPTGASGPAPAPKPSLAPTRAPDGHAELCELVPEIPGIMRSSLATRTRAGIALRIDVDTGAVRDLTVATAFPAPLLPVAEVAKRVGSWADSLGGDPTAHHRLAEVLLPGHIPNQGRGIRAYSLFTRTISPRGNHTTIYVRPAWPAHPALQS